MSLHLHNGRAGMRGGVRHLIGKLRQHEQMIAARALGRITRTGGPEADDAGALESLRLPGGASAAT
jgi:hypothetical protein